MDPKKPIRRSTRDRLLGGVLAGIARWLDCDPSVARVAYVLLTAFTGFALGIVAYAILWLFLPTDDARSTLVPGPSQRPTEQP